MFLRDAYLQRRHQARGRDLRSTGHRQQCAGGREIGDRERAIAEALNGLAPGDVLAVAGKGHEQGQTIGDAVIPFDDVDVVRRLVGTA